MDRERKEEEGSVYFTMLCYYGPTKRLQIGKEVCQGYILSPCLFNLYVEYIMKNTGLR